MKKLNFGCGRDIKPKKEGWVNVDVQKGEGIDKSFNFENFPYPFKDNTFDYVLIKEVLEHMIDIKLVMNELWRIGKKDAIIEVFVPYWNHSAAHNAPDHKHCFNKRTFEVICEKDTQAEINPENKFELIEIELIPTRMKRIFPVFILNFLDRFLHGIFIGIKAKIKIKKGL
jgi:SAM-dependent methyltransferase